MHHRLQEDILTREGSIQLVPWSKSWLQRFSIEKVRWRQMLGTICLEVHHIGSTSVRGMAAKPIIDVMVVVTSHQQLDELTGRIEENRYQAKGSYGIAGRRYFHRDENGRRACHIHAYECVHPQICKHLRFRDILEAHPATALDYQRLKIELAERFREDKTGYALAKGPFIERVLASNTLSGACGSAFEIPQ